MVRNRKQNKKGLCRELSHRAQGRKGHKVNLHEIVGIGVHPVLGILQRLVALRFHDLAIETNRETHEVFLAKDATRAQMTQALPWTIRGAHLGVISVTTFPLYLQGALRERFLQGLALTARVDIEDLPDLLEQTCAAFSVVLAASMQEWFGPLQTVPHFDQYCTSKIDDIEKALLAAQGAFLNARALEERQARTVAKMLLTYFTDAAEQLMGTHALKAFQAFDRNANAGDNTVRVVTDECGLAFSHSLTLGYFRFGKDREKYRLGMEQEINRMLISDQEAILATMAVLEWACESIRTMVEERLGVEAVVQVEVFKGWRAAIPSVMLEAKTRLEAIPNILALLDEASSESDD